MTSESDIVKLDVGGQMFKTTRATLISNDGFFKKILELDKMQIDENGCIFIDRDPRHFRLILNFMRDGDVDLPDCVKEIQEIKKEAECYMLEKLVAMCAEKIPVKEPCKFRIIDSDMDMVNIITNPKKPVLIIHYKMENWENATKYFDLVAFQAKYTEFEVYFKASTSPEPTWSFSIHDKVPSLFSTPRSCQENNFVFNLERAIDRFLEARKKWFS